MLSPDGETAPFAENVIIDGAVELWLVCNIYTSYALYTTVVYVNIVCMYIRWCYYSVFCSYTLNNLYYCRIYYILLIPNHSYIICILLYVYIGWYK